METSKQLKRDLRKVHSHVSEKTEKAERFRLLKLAIDWDCIDIAKELLFKNSLDNIMVK